MLGGKHVLFLSFWINNIDGIALSSDIYREQ